MDKFLRILLLDKFATQYLHNMWVLTNEGHYTQAMYCQFQYLAYIDESLEVWDSMNFDERMQYHQLMCKSMGAPNSSLASI